MFPFTPEIIFDNGQTDNREQLLLQIERGRRASRLLIQGKITYVPFFFLLVSFFSLPSTHLAVIFLANALGSRARLLAFFSFLISYRG